MVYVQIVSASFLGILMVGINGKVHTQVSNAWAAWKQSLGGRIPTQAEVMAQALKIDELFKNHWVFPK